MVWLQSRSLRANLIFGIAACAGAFMTLLELNMMYSETPEQYGRALRLFHIPLGVALVSLAWFVRFYLNAGRLWLVWLFCGLRITTLVLTFVLTPNLNFREITGLQEFHALGETLVVAIGEKNPWTNITNASALVLLIFLVDASIAAWRRGSRRRALVLGGTFGTVIVVGLMASELFNRSLLPLPVTVSLLFLIILAGVAYELGSDLARTSAISRELSESQERMKLASSAANLGMWEWDVARDEIWVTEAIRRRIGLGATERATLDRFLQSLHPEDRAPTRANLDQALEGESEFQAEYRSIDAEGGTRWIAARGRIERDDNGEPLRVRGVSVDITNRKLAEQKVRRAAEFNQQVLASLDHEIAILDRSGAIIEVNEAWKDFARANGNNVHWKGANYLTTCRAAASAGDTTASEVLDGVRSVLEGTRSFFEIEYPCAAPGVERFFLMRVVPLQTPAGGAVVSHIDITPVRRSELELQSLRRDLAHLSRVSTIGQLSTAMAHELNQPLGAILSNAEAAEMLLDANPPALDQVREILTDIRQDDERAGEVIRRMRALLRKEEMRMAPLDIGVLVPEILRLVSSEAAMRKVSFRMKVAPGPLPVRGDRVHLQQVMLNLILNAMDAVAESHSDERRVVVQAGRNQGGDIEVAISDNGPGIPPQQLARLFEPFFSTKPQGMGIGTSIARTIIQAHQGRIWAENNATGGATLRFTLPVDDRAESEHYAAVPKRAEPTETQP
jgi:PAS domain S-box-containing protein